MEQVTIDWDYDDRVPTLALEFGIMLAPKLATGTTTAETKDLATRLALLASRRLSRLDEPDDPVRCQSCGVETVPAQRVRVPVCLACSLRGPPSPGT